MASQEHVLLSTEQYNRLIQRIKDAEEIKEENGNDLDNIIDNGKKNTLTSPKSTKADEHQQSDISNQFTSGETKNEISIDKKINGSGVSEQKSHRQNISDREKTKSDFQHKTEGEGGTTLSGMISKRKNEGEGEKTSKPGNDEKAWRNGGKKVGQRPTKFITKKVLKEKLSPPGKRQTGKTSASGKTSDSPKKKWLKLR